MLVEHEQQIEASVKDNENTLAINLDMFEPQSARDPPDISLDYVEESVNVQDRAPDLQPDETAQEE